MKKHSLAVLAAFLLIVPARLSAQEIDLTKDMEPQQPPVPEVVVPVIPEVTEPVTEVQEETTIVEEPVKIKKEKVKKEKVVKEKTVKEKKEKGEKTYGLFNHLGIGVSAGLMDGLTANVGLPIGGHFAIRGGYNFLSSVYSYQTNANLGTWKMDNSTTIDLSKTPVKADIVMQYYGMIDFYLSKKSAFHLTAGLFGGDGEIVHATADLTNVDQLTKEDYAKTAISYNDLSVSTDSDGFVHAGLRANKNLMPYFGLGWGRVCNLKSWLSLSLDLGLLKTSGFEIYARDYKNKQDSPVSSATVEHNDKFDFTGLPVVGKLGEQTDLIDKAKSGDLPVLKDFLPCIKIGINIRLF